MKNITSEQLEKGIVLIFDHNQRILQKLGNFPSIMYLRCLIAICLRSANALCGGDKSKALRLISDVVNECVTDKLDVL